MAGKNAIDIDRERLDEEWIAQPGLFLEAAEKLASAKEMVNSTKAAMELVEAETARNVRNDPETYGLEKVTEPAIDAAIKLQDSYKIALKKYNRAKYSQDMAQAYVDALDHRKKALENLVRLFEMSYFSEPTMPKSNRNVGKKK